MMLKATFTACIICLSLSLAAQDTHYAQFFLETKVDGERKADLEAGLAALPGVLQARVSADGQNVIMSSIPGIPVLETEVKTVLTVYALTHKCFQDGIIGERPIRSLRSDCSRSATGRVQD